MIKTREACRSDVQVVLCNVALSHEVRWKHKWTAGIGIWIWTAARLELSAVFDLADCNFFLLTSDESVVQGRRTTLVM
jgi:hypothetical protein